MFPSFPTKHVSGFGSALRQTWAVEPGSLGLRDLSPRAMKVTTTENWLMTIQNRNSYCGCINPTTENPTDGALRFGGASTPISFIDPRGAPPVADARIRGAGWERDGWRRPRWRLLFLFFSRETGASLRTP